MSFKKFARTKNKILTKNEQSKLKGGASESIIIVDTTLE